jgi:hypothetical protein
MEMTFECPQCHRSGRVPSVEAAAAATCSHCGASREVRGAAFDAGRLECCAWCATTDLYMQKDFPHGLGLLIVVAGFLMSTVFVYYYMPILTMVVLLATAALDVALYYLVPDVTICYRCLSQFRGAGSNPDGRFPPFDLAVGERYRQERLRVEDLRRAASPDQGG